MSDASGVTAFLHFYKVYHLDKCEKIKQSALVMAADDADALRKAGALAIDHDVEVWDRSRHVGTVEVGTVEAGTIDAARDGSTLPTEAMTAHPLSQTVAAAALATA